MLLIEKGSYLEVLHKLKLMSFNTLAHILFIKDDFYRWSYNNKQIYYYKYYSFISRCEKKIKIRKIITYFVRSII